MGGIDLTITLTLEYWSTWLTILAVTEWNITDFQNLIDYCIAEGIEFLTMSQAYNRWHV